MDKPYNTIKALAKLDPNALSMVASSLEARANMAATNKPRPIDTALVDIYELLAALVDLAHEQALEEAEESALEEAIIREANERFLLERSVEIQA